MSIDQAFTIDQIPFTTHIIETVHKANSKLGDILVVSAIKKVESNLNNPQIAPPKNKSIAISQKVLKPINQDNNNPNSEKIIPSTNKQIGMKIK